MTDICYRFHIRIGNFEFEVEGERSFVERTLNRYEGRFLPKFQQLLDKIPAAEIVQKPPQRIEETRAPVPQRHEPEPVHEREKERERDREKEPRRDERRFDKKDRRGRDRYRGPKDRNANNRVMPAPTLPRDQEVIKTPYIPPEGFDMGGVANEDETIPPPVPLLERVNEEMKKTQAPEVVRELAVVTDEDIEDEEAPAVLLEGDQSEDSLKRFYETLNPRTHHEKIMVFGYFLQVRRGMAEFGTGKIKSCYDAASADPAGNINQVLNHACRTGFVTKSQRGRSVKYSLTSKGKQFVERGLQSA